MNDSAMRFTLLGRWLWLALFAALATAGLSGCNKKEPPKFVSITFHVEGEPTLPASMVTRLQRAQGNDALLVRRKPEFVGLEVTGVDLRGEGRDQYLLLSLSAQASQRLYNASVSNRGKFLFMVTDGVPVAYRKLDRVLNESILPMWVDLPVDQYETFLADLQQSIQRAQEIANEN
ncbi:MAG: hypothetical protein ACFB20_08790 [Opitutales bacterium]